ncbi:hypothetical protein TrRE_jg7069 [Triparma retinervis]|uniref:Calmodulin n=1 Tax=Triparma retinervis TaxID=2557542 RepID=A0A9W7AR43_9STRA|nr:hypothetical protein TrRE_jg7069 [Triparma retinervis]
MRTKFAKLESLFKQKQRAEGGSTGAIDLGDGDGMVGGRRADKDNEQLVTDLYKRNAKLQRENKGLEAKHKALGQTCAKLKRELQLARRRGGTKMASKTNDSSFHAENLTSNVTAASSSLSSSKLAELVDKLRHRLINAEKQLGKLREENNSLRGGTKLGVSSTGVRDDMDSSMAAARSAKWASSTVEGEEILRLQRELRDTAAKLQLLQTRYDHMESKTKAQNELQQGSFEQLEEYNRKIRDLRMKVQEAQHDKEVAEARASRAEDLEEENRELQAEYQSLEDKFMRIDAVGGPTAGRSALETFDRQHQHERQHKQKIEKLQEVAQTHLATLTALQKECDLLKREKEGLQKQLDRSENSNRESSYAHQVSRDKGNLFGSMSDLADLGMEDIDMKELEHALAIVRRKMDDPTDLDFLEKVDDGDMDIKKRLQMVQVANLNITRELERAERMLKAQASINRDLHLELEEAQKRQRMEKDSLQAKLEDFESLCLKRLQRIHSLEAQVRQHLYAVGGSGGGKFKKTPAALDDVVGLLDEEDNLLQEISSGDFGPDENLIEVYIVDAEISENTVTSDASTFVLVDFFDYESQATPLVTGLYPRYDFATTYKVTVDDFFLRFLATDSLSIELNKAHNADYLLLAKATVTLSALLESSPRVLLSRLPLISTKDGSVAGYVHIEVRMALPVTELYRLFLDRHPEERSRIESVARKNLKSEIVMKPDGSTASVSALTTSNLGPREEARLSNELSVTVKSASGLVKKGRQSPSTYVHYQLLGFQDTFTNVVEFSSEPSFNHSFSFPIVTDPKLLRFLRKYKLTFTVFEDNNGDGDDDGNTLFGEAKLPLSLLSNGDDIIETVTLFNSHKHEVGTIEIEIRWNSPLKRPADAGPNALTAPEVEEIMSRFGPDKDGQVNYMDFVRFADPQPAVIAALESFSTFLTMARKEQGITTAEFFEALSDGRIDSNSKAAYIDSEAFVSGLMKMQIGIPPDELAAVFTHIDASGENMVNVRDFVKFAEPPVSSATTIITEKLRLRCQHLHRLGTPIMVPFQKADTSGSYRVTRLQFKECLREMGFQLVDDEYSTGRVVKSSVKPKRVFETDQIDDDEEIIGGTNAKDMKDVINERFDNSRSRAGTTSTNAAAAENEKRRVEFEKRVKELTQQNNAAAASIDFEGLAGDGLEEETENINSSNKSMTMTAPSRRKPPTGKSATQQQQPYETPLRPDMAATHTGIAQTPSSSVSKIDSSAAAAASKSAAAVSGDSMDSMNIVDVETVLTDCCKVFKGAKVLPEGLKKALQNADDGSEGYLGKRKFASTVASIEGMSLLSSDALKSVMDFFQKTRTGSQIDYRAFLTFMGWKKPAVSNGVSLMSKMLLHSTSAMDEFSKFDKEGSGYLKRAEFYEGLRELGYNKLSSSDMDDIAILFEFGARKGEVYYGAFVEYVTQQESILELKEVESRLRSSIRNHYRDSSVGAADELRAAFSKLDPDSKGVLDANDFASGLDNLGFKLTRSDMDALYVRADPSGEGVSYKDFVSFIVDGADDGFDEPQKSLSDFDMAILQLKCFNVVNECMARLPNIESLSDAFKHYDWRRSGKLGLRSFASAVRSSGFTLSRAEIVVLAQHFGDGRGPSVIVPYNEFLNWATPDSSTSVPVIGGNSVNLESLMANLRRLAARSESGSFRKWSDVFETMDVDGSGIVDEEGCRMALKRLGVKISEAESRALSVEYGGGKKGAVRYRHLLRILFPGAAGEENGKGVAALRRLQASANRLDSDLSEISRKAREIFGELDLDGLGYVTKKGFKRGMIKLVNRLNLAAPSDNDLEELMDRFDTGGDGSVGWKEFVSESFGGGGSGSGEELEAVSRFKAMMRKCIRKGIDYRAAFDKLDEGYKGSLSLIDFKAALQDLGGGLTEGEINALAVKFKSPAAARRGETGDGARVVLYLELLHSLMPARDIEWEEPDGWRIEEKLRSMIKNRFEFWVPGKLKKAFKFFDKPTPRGKIGIDQLSDGLKRLKAFRLSASQEKKLFDIMDLSGSGRITTSDFVTFVRDSTYNDVCMKCISELGKATVMWSEVKKNLEKKDESGRGIVSMKDFKSVLSKLQCDLSKSDILRLMARFDDEDSQNVNIAKFVDFVKQGGKRKGDEEGELFSDDEEDDEEDSGDEDDEDTGSGKKKKATALMKKLKKRLQAAEDKGVSAKRSFKFFDKDGSGDIDEDEFRQGVKKLLKINLTKSESSALMDKFKSRRIGKIKYTEFLKGLGLGESEDDDEDDMDDENDDDDEEEVGSKKSKKKDKDKDKDKEKNKKKKDGDFAAMVRKEINRMSRKGKTKPKFKTVFKTFDKDDNGTLSAREFKRALIKMGFEFTSGQLTRLIDRLDEDGDDSISWKEFERFSKMNTGGDDSEEESEESEEEKMSNDEMKKLIQKQMKKMGKRGDKPNVRRGFTRADRDEEDFLTKRKFKKCVEDMGFEFDSDDLNGIIKKLDKKGKGNVYYGAFVKYAKVDDDGSGDESGDDERRADVDDLALMVRKELRRLTKSEKGPPKLRRTFEEFDRDGSGSLNAREFKKALTKMGFKFKTDEIDRLLDYLDSDGDGRIDFKEYESLVGAEIEVDSDASDDDETDSPYAALMDKVTAALDRGRDVLEAFEYFDGRGNGEISEDDFKEGLEKLRIKANGKAIRQAFSKFKGRRAGKIKYTEFVRAVEKGGKKQGGKKKGGRKEYDDDDEISRKLKKEFKRVTKSSNGPPRIRAVFEEIDTNGNGKIDEGELRRGLDTMGFELSRREVRDVMKKFDNRDKGEIDFDDFAFFLTGDDEDGSGSDDGDESDSDELVEMVRKEFKRITKSSRGPPRIQSTFDEMDTNGDGVVSKREFRNALDEMGFRFSERQIKDVLFKIDKNNDGGCDYEEFEKLCTGKKGKKGGRGGFDIDDDIVKKLRKAKVVKRGKLVGELENADEDANRRSKEYLKVKDFENFVRESMDDARLSRSELKDLVRSCDPDDTGKVKYEKFAQVLDR